MALLCLGLVCSCVSRKEIVYFQGLDKAESQMSQAEENGLKIRPNDLLTISVSAPEQAAAMPFNLPVVGMPQGGMDQDLNVQRKAAIANLSC